MIPFSDITSTKSTCTGSSDRLSSLRRRLIIPLCSVHLYTGFGSRDRSQKDKEYHRAVYGPEAAEQGIEIAHQLIEKARIAKGVTKPVKLSFDEWNGWDEELGTQPHDLSYPEYRYCLAYLFRK